MKHLLEEARQMIRLGSVSSSGNEEVVNYIATLFKERGFITHQQQVMHSLENIGKRQFNIIGILGDPLVDKKTRKGLLLTTHLDTAGPGLLTNWTETSGAPFSVAVKEGKIYGLGTADAKLDFLCKLRAVEKFREKKLRMPIYLVGTCGAELGMLGAKYLIKSLALNPKYVVVGGPTNLKAVYGHKCMVVYRVSIGYQMVERDARGFNRRIDFYSYGRSAHGACPHLGINAITQASEFLQAAADNGFETRFTRLDGGDSGNKVPDQALAEFFLTSHQFEDFKRFFREFARTEGKEKAFKVELGGLGDTGVRFLPDVLFPCIMDIGSFFRNLSDGFERATDSSYSPPFSTVNFSLLKQKLGGVDLFYDLRLLATSSLEETEKQIFMGVQTIASRYPGLNISISRDLVNPSLNMTLQHDLIRICRDAMVAAGIEAVFDKSSASTEASQYYHAGHEALVFGPGNLQGNSRSPNEHNFLDQIDKAVVFYEKLIERVCT